MPAPFPSLGPVTPVLLLPSPLVGQATWAPAADVLRATGRSVTVADPREVPDLPRPLLVAHSNAGLFAPGLAARLDAVATVYVDAALAGEAPDTSLAPPAALLDHLRTLADADGLLPPWTQWWPSADVDDLFPSAAARAQVEAAEPRLPLAYFETRVAVPPGWTSRPCAYLAFGDTYADEVARSRSLGWPVEVLEGRHLHQVVDPEAVVAAVLRLADAA